MTVNPRLMFFLMLSALSFILVGGMDNQFWGGIAAAIIVPAVCTGFLYLMDSVDRDGEMNDEQ